MNKKILIATGLYPPQSGGPATYATLLEERLPTQGFEVAVLPYMEVRHVPKVFRHFAYFLKCFRLARRADIVYALDTVSVGFPAMLAATFAGKKFMVRVPGDYAWEQARQRFGVKDELDDFQTKRYGRRVELMRRLQKRVVRRAAAVVVPSDYLKRIVSGWLVPGRVEEAEKIHRIYSSVDLSSAPAPIERPIGFLVVSTGRRVPWKGFEALERAVAQERDWTLRIIHDMPRAQALGWVKAADVYVLNSTYEGLSHALVEAMMLGTPIVATRVGGNPELVEDGVTGLLIPPKDDEALRTALKRVHDDAVAARARAAAAQTRAKEFSIDNTIGQLCELLKTL
jgi:glycosyltransferase involved in cell wall biosynthesis